VVTQTDDGEVTLAPEVNEEFSDATLPVGWSTIPWDPGGGATVNGGSLNVDGARTGTDATYGPGRSLEFVSTFGVGMYQHMGFGNDFNAAPWAIFSTKDTSDSLFARTSNGSSSTDTLIPGNWRGAPHRYRIQWTDSSVIFFIDGNQMVSHPIIFDPVTQKMRPLVSDFYVGGPSLSVDWLRMSGYVPSGTFTSRVFDGGQSVTWRSASWTADTPAGTSITLSIRSGDTANPTMAHGPPLSSFRARA